MPRGVTEDPSPLLGTLARLYAVEGNARMVALLASAAVSIEQIEWDNWNGGTGTYEIRLELPTALYAQIQRELDAIHQELATRLSPLWSAKTDHRLSAVTLSPKFDVPPDWQDRAQAWLAGRGISNQGRVRSNNIASRELDGLLFRSQPEIHLYTALKAAGVSFAPLPVFVRGGDTYRRLEPDFVLLKDGLVMVVEVDGDTVHHETPAEAHARTTMLEHEGAQVEHVNASDCDTPEKARLCAAKLIAVISKVKASRS